MYDIVVTTHPGLEEILSEEIREITGRITCGSHYAYIEIQGELSDIVKMNINSRIATRVLVRFAQFTFGDLDDLYAEAKKLKWSSFLNPRRTFELELNGRHGFKGLNMPLLRVKDAIADHFREKTGSRPSVDKERPDVRISLYIEGNSMKVFIDSSYHPLYHRGYRTRGHFSPMKENLAAGLIRLSGWDGRELFYDGFCGTGTIPIEAFLIKNGIQPQVLRKDFGLAPLTDNAETLIRKEKRRIDIKYKKGIIGNDISPKALHGAGESLGLFSRYGGIDFRMGDFLKKTAPADKGLLLINPPYGERTDMEKEFPKYLGDKLKHDFKGWAVHIFSANNDFIKNIGLRAKRKIPVKNGAIDSRLCYYPIF